jgi:hypothetical protein
MADRNRTQNVLPSDLLTRRRLLSGSAATAAAFSGICALHPADASAPVAKAQGPGVYRYRLGNYQLTALYDGLWPIPIDDDFVRNASRAQVDKALAAGFLPPGILSISFTPAQTAARGNVP